MTEKYLNLNLDDEKAGKVAEILANKTAKKILSIIAENENLSQSDISSKLNIPLNTLDYNIKKLLSAGLIEKNKDFFWSVKGKKIPTYRLANKKIIISTKSIFKTSGLLASMLGVGAVLGALKMFVNYVADKTVYSASFNSALAEKSSDLAISSINAPTTPSGASESMLVQTGNGISIFQGVLFWIVIGMVLGLIGYFILKKTGMLKGGKN
jgi:DNA-binding transcriptional ArsR family regulator